jgi:uncharacterized protein
MQINVSQLLQEPIGATREYLFDDESDILGDGNKRETHVECRLMRTRRGILVSCRVETDIELGCSRCLNRFRYPLRIKFEEEFLPTINITDGTPVLQEEAGAFTIDENHIIDLTEPARQYALMAVPMKPLCRKDCAGLCAKCGKNLNQGNCDCPTEEIDPRWAKLARLSRRK